MHNIDLSALKDANPLLASQKYHSKHCQKPADVDLCVFALTNKQILNMYNRAMVMKIVDLLNSMAGWNQYPRNFGNVMIVPSIDNTFGMLRNAQINTFNISLFELVRFFYTNQSINTTMKLEFITTELKAFSSNHGESKVVRIGKGLKIMIVRYKLVIRGVNGAVMVETLICGINIQFLKLSGASSITYLSVELTNLNLLRFALDITLIPPLVERFYQLKDIFMRAHNANI
ncbi:hypothetical protein BDA99DRAFT_595170 [Phascolomyces articulosus]|uniref:Uncharacterized protein n=1 Tax=Phascolomyces articulosus TaxID=60185 RepID=A0AAD5KHP2_9FUNG|nr:hypothetical protein BDA99DRAFT_595170 [Phascolomyces articulosus]